MMHQAVGMHYLGFLDSNSQNSLRVIQAELRDFIGSTDPETMIDLSDSVPQ